MKGRRRVSVARSISQVAVTTSGLGTSRVRNRSMEPLLLLPRSWSSFLERGAEGGARGRERRVFSKAGSPRTVSTSRATTSSLGV